MLAEKVYALLLIYCGLSHEQALTALCQCCNLVMTEHAHHAGSGHCRRPLHNYIKQVVARVLLDPGGAVGPLPERTLEELATIAYGNLLDIAGGRRIEGYAHRFPDADPRAGSLHRLDQTGHWARWLGLLGGQDARQDQTLGTVHEALRDVDREGRISVDDSWLSYRSGRRRAGLTAEERPALEA